LSPFFAWSPVKHMDGSTPLQLKYESSTATAVDVLSNIDQKRREMLDQRMAGNIPSTPLPAAVVPVIATQSPSQTPTAPVQAPLGTVPRTPPRAQSVKSAAIEIEEIDEMDEQMDHKSNDVRAFRDFE